MNGSRARLDRVSAFRPRSTVLPSKPRRVDERQVARARPVRRAAPAPVEASAVAASSSSASLSKR